MASLRSTILLHSLPLLPLHSFTRQTLSLALTTLPKSDPAYRSEPLSDSVIDTIFGPGQLASQTLVEAWQAEGLKYLNGQTSSSESPPAGSVSPNTQSPTSPSPSTSGMSKEKVNIQDMLEKRLEYSSKVGEHLVEAYALLASPSSNPSLPIPTIPLPLKHLLGMKLPPLYTPPQVRALHGTLNTTSSILDSISDRTNGRIPFLRFNPFGPLGYAWNISDEAMYQVEKTTEVKRGVMGEPIGAGPEYYASRLGLAVAYLSAESQLLQPIPTALPGIDNPHLPLALDTLHKNLKTYESIAGSMEGMEKSAGEMMGFVDFVGKSWKGLIKSRYW